MSREIKAFCNNQIEKCKFQYRKNLILLDHVYIDNKLISSMISFSENNYKFYTLSVT